MTTKQRKTVPVAELLTRVNRALTDAADYQNETMGLEGAKLYRQGLATVLEDVLMATGNYKGFRYTDPNAKFTDTGIAPGTYDETRRAYYAA